MLKKIIALFAVVALALSASIGVASAAGLVKDQVRSKHIKIGTIKLKDIKPGVVRSLDESAEIAALEKRVAELEVRVAGQASNGGTGNRQPWVGNGASAVENGSVVLRGDNTSVETANLDVPVQSGDLITFTYTLAGGATCTAGSPRMFVEIQGVPGLINSFDGNPDQCGGADDVVSFVVPQNGRLGAAGFVHDNGSGGTVTISNLTIGGEPFPLA